MQFSRHAKNNMRLYNIAEEDIVRAIEAPDSKGREGNRLIILKRFSDKFAGNALKVVFEKSAGSVTVITAYPLKRKHWR